MQSIGKADLAILGIEETWIDLGKYETFVMGNHTSARQTEEWLEKWIKYWKQIGTDDGIRRSKIKTSAPLSLLQLISSAEGKL